MHQHPPANDNTELTDSERRQAGALTALAHKARSLTEDDRYRKLEKEFLAMAKQRSRTRQSEASEPLA